jgi:hypothetical protein
VLLGRWDVYKRVRTAMHEARDGARV